MTSPGSGSRLRSAPMGAFLPLALQVITVIAVIAMFVLVWGPRSDDSDLRDRELAGVEYVTALNELLPVLTDASSAAVQGKAVPKSTYTEALNKVAAIDDEHGSDFDTTNRWAGLRTRIEALPEQYAGDADGASRDFSEVTDLTLALYARVADASGLRTDPDAVISYLQDAAVEEMPSAMVWAARYHDQAVITGALTLPAPGTAEATFQTQMELFNESMTSLSIARQTAGESGGDVAADMAAAVESAESGAFSPNLVRNLDAFQRGVEALAPPGETALSARPDPKAVGPLRTATQAAAVALNPVLLDELKTQIEDRQSGNTTARLLALGLVVLAVIAAIVAFVVILIGRRRARQTEPEPEPDPYGGRRSGGNDYQGYSDYSNYPGAEQQIGGDPYLNNPDAGRDARRERVGVPR